MIYGGRIGVGRCLLKSKGGLKKLHTLSRQKFEGRGRREEKKGETIVVIGRALFHSTEQGCLKRNTKTQ